MVWSRISRFSNEFVKQDEIKILKIKILKTGKKQDIPYRILLTKRETRTSKCMISQKLRRSCSTLPAMPKCSASTSLGPQSRYKPVRGINDPDFLSSYLVSETKVTQSGIQMKLL